MNQLYIREGDIVVVQNVSLSLATFSKFQPQSVDFLDITNPKAVYPPLYHHPVQLKRPGSLILRHTYPQILWVWMLGNESLCHSSLDKFSAWRANFARLRASRRVTL